MLHETSSSYFHQKGRESTNPKPVDMRYNKLLLWWMFFNDHLPILAKILHDYAHFSQIPSLLPPHIDDSSYQMTMVLSVKLKKFVTRVTKHVIIIVYYLWIFIAPLPRWLQSENVFYLITKSNLPRLCVAAADFEWAMKTSWYYHQSDVV